MIRGIVLACALALSCSTAAAHSWFEGMVDPVSKLPCCDERDCTETGFDTVIDVAGGYIYLPLDDGSGPNADNPGFIPDVRVLISKTDGYAVCLGGGQFSTGNMSTTTPVFIRCFFAPSGF